MRRYIDEEDLKIDFENHNESLYHHIEQLLKNIIVQEFKTISQDFYLDNVSDTDNNVKFLCRLAVEDNYVVPNKSLTKYPYSEYTSQDFLKSFLQIYPIALKNISKKMSPISDKKLNDAGLSEDQFIIQLISLSIYPEVRVFQEESETALYVKEIYIELILNIEDITELQPDGLQMLSIKYTNLCQDNSRYSLNELTEWVESLGYKVGTKQQMCRIIKNHYNF
jgi:hypothetical protein